MAGLGLAAALPGALSDAAQSLLGVLATHRFTLTDVGIVMAACAAASWVGTVYTLQKD